MASKIRYFFTAILGLLLFGCQPGGMLPGSTPMGASKPSSTTSSPDSTDSNITANGESDKTSSAGSGMGTGADPSRFDASGSLGSGGSSGSGGSATGATVAAKQLDPVSAQVGSADIGCPEGADGGDYCHHKTMMMYRSGQLSDDPRERLIKEVRYVRVVEVPAEVATNLNLTSADDFLQRVQLGTITDTDAKAVTYRDVAVTVLPDGTFEAPALKLGLNLVYKSPAKGSETPQSFQSNNEIQSTISSAAYLSSEFRSLRPDTLRNFNLKEAR